MKIINRISVPTGDILITDEDESAITCGNAILSREC